MENDLLHLKPAFPPYHIWNDFFHRIYESKENKKECFLVVSGLLHQGLLKEEDGYCAFTGLYQAFKHCYGIELKVISAMSCHVDIDPTSPYFLDKDERTHRAIIDKYRSSKKLPVLTGPFDWL